MSKSQLPSKYSYRASLDLTYCLKSNPNLRRSLETVLYLGATCLLKNWIIYSFSLFFLISPPMNCRILPPLPGPYPSSTAHHSSHPWGSLWLSTTKPLTSVQIAQSIPLWTPTLFRPVCKVATSRWAGPYKESQRPPFTQHACQKKETQKATLALSHILNWLPGAFPTLFTEDCVCFLSV